MIKVIIEMKDDTYNELLNHLYVDAIGMKSDVFGEYYSDDNVLYETFRAWKDLMSEKWFKDNVVSFRRIVDDEDDDLIESYFNLLNKGLIKA